MQSTKTKMNFFLFLLVATDVQLCVKSITQFVRTFTFYQICRPYRHKMNVGWSCIRLNDGPNIKLVDLFKLVGAGLSLVFCLIIRGSTRCFLLLRYFSGIVSHHGILQVRDTSS